MLDLLHRIVAIPRIYDFTQRIVGGKKVVDHLAERLLSYHDQVAYVADIGGGTGLFRSVWPRETNYLCVDIDPAKVYGFRDKHPEGWTASMDGATALATESCDAIMIVFVTHHLPDDVVQPFLAECVRALKRGGILVLCDPLWSPRNLPGRCLWAVDRGSHPRTGETLSKLLRNESLEPEVTQLSILHDYWIGIATRD